MKTREKLNKCSEECCKVRAIVWKHGDKGRISSKHRAVEEYIIVMKWPHRKPKREPLSEGENYKMPCILYGRLWVLSKSQ